MASVSGTAELMTVPFLVGLSTGDQEPVHAQVNCLVGPVERVLLGSDLLSLLGLELRVDYHQKRVQLERYTWERFEDEGLYVVSLDVSQSIEKVQRFVRQATDVIADREGSAMYEISAGFPNAKPGFEYVVLEMKKGG